METTPQPAVFDRAYAEGDPPWVIGEPQPAVVTLADRGVLTGRVLEPGCGTGEHTVHLTRLGLDVLGTDASPTAIARARDRARAHGVAARFAVADALHPGELGRFDTVLDSALFHLFDAGDQARYARALSGLLVPGGTVHLLALARTGGRELGPVIDASTITDAFTAPDWTVEEIGSTTYRGIVTEDLAQAHGEPAGTVVDVAAHLARITRS